MFRAMISPIFIFMSTILCFSLWHNTPTMLPVGNFVGALYHKL